MGWNYWKSGDRIIASAGDMASLGSDYLSKNERGGCAGCVSHAQRLSHGGRALPREQPGVRRSRRERIKQRARSVSGAFGAGVHLDGLRREGRGGNLRGLLRDLDV